MRPLRPAARERASGTGEGQAPSRRWVDSQQELLQFIARGAPLGLALQRLVHELEQQLRDVECAVLLLDEITGRLWTAAGPSTPPTRRAGCSHWWKPIAGTSGRVLGTVALYGRTPGVPSSRHQAMAEDAARIAAIAIERPMVERALADYVPPEPPPPPAPASAEDAPRAGAAAPTLESLDTSASSIIGSAADAIICADEDGRIVVFNPAAERVFRVTAQDAIGSSLDRFLPPDTRARNVEQVVRTAGQAPIVYGVRNDGERFPTDATTSRTTVDGRPLRIVILRDITEREQQEAQHRQTQRMDAMGKLAGGVAHDFNNLLTAIRASAEMMMAELPAGQTWHDAEQILMATDRAASLTRQLLAFSRTQVLRRETHSIDEIVRGVEPLLHRVLSESVRLVVTPSAEPPLAAVDATQIEQLLVHLVTNARDSMPDGGTIHVRTEVRPRHALPTLLERRGTLGASERVVLLSVRDDGSGMDDATRTRAFEPFFTTKEQGRGTGLGLATVYGIVDQSGGTVGLESAPGAGTTVWIALPLAQAPVAAPSSAPRPTPARERWTILLVDDEAAVRTIARRVLERAGYAVVEASNGVEALAVWAQHRSDGPEADDPIDLVITDMIMPQLGGRELAQRLRAEQPDLPLLFVSGYLEGGLTESETAPNTAFLEKPFTTAMLLQQVKGLLGE